jgi:DNA topoisomerase-1
MNKNLVIVESPAKSKTIKKYLGNNFEVLASYGHVRELKPRESSVDVDNEFEMKYQLIEKNKRSVEAIKKAVKSSETIYLATDPDREGEAISWHIYEVLKDSKLLNNKIVHRITFNEITRSAVTESIAKPKKLEMNLINAQQARRALDFLVGFKLSPLLWKKIRQGLSAGRVQSPALRMIVERELEIESFEIKEYWDVKAVLQKGRKFFANLTEYNQKKLEQFSIRSQDEANKTLETVKISSGKTLIVDKIVRKQKKKKSIISFHNLNITTGILKKTRVYHQKNYGSCSAVI